MKIYLFDKDYAKQYKAYWSEFKYISLILLAILPVSFIFGFSMAYFEESLSEMMSIILGVGYLAIFLPLVIWVAYYGEIFYLAKTTAYVLDEWKVLWQVQFIQKNSFKRIDYSEDNIRDYFIRYRQGESFYNVFFGGTCRITRLKDLELVKDKMKYGVFNYKNDKDKTRKIRISYAYPGLESYFKKYSWY